MKTEKEIQEVLLMIEKSYILLNEIEQLKEKQKQKLVDLAFFLEKGFQYLEDTKTHKGLRIKIVRVIAGFFLKKGKKLINEEIAENKENQSL